VNKNLIGIGIIIFVGADPAVEKLRWVQKSLNPSDISASG
jgi:hypothetical protein